VCGLTTVDIALGTWHCADMALERRLFFATTAELWLNLQRDYELGA
jgi:plasmid maintenance system antidote protein VapI